MFVSGMSLRTNLQDTNIKFDKFEQIKYSIMS